MAISCIRMALFILLTPCAAALATPSNTTDLAALLAFKAQLKDPLGIVAGNWTATTSFCSWIGVSCSHGRQRVTGLQFNHVPLEGSIAPQLGNLSFLSNLVLRNTSLVGPLPTELGTLHRLRSLVLPNNSLSGTIPCTLANLTRLELLDLASNNFIGAIPYEFQNLHSLQMFQLVDNDLSGEIPQDMFNNTPSLSIIHLGSNRLTGRIPRSIITLSNLEKLVLQKNLLSGPMPPPIFNMSQLQALAVGRNNLSGPIPGNESFHLPMLQVLALPENQFNGPIPLGLSACQNLETLNLAVNNFTGTVPSLLATLPNLTAIYLSTNDLTGKIPTELSNQTTLLGLDVSENNLEGEIPPELGNLRNLGNMLNLSEIFINYNQLSGKLHFLAALSKCRRLNTIHISGNKFTGRLPPYMGNLSTMLEIFAAGNDMITGSIPSTVANLSNLLILSLRGNNLSGKIPTTIGAMDNLQGLYLSYNSLSGNIPEEISGLTKLVELYLGANKLTDPIPSSSGNLSQLQFMALSQNSLSSTIPTSLWHLQKLMVLDLSQNSLTGFLPADVTKLTAITAMDLSGNKLSGSIPDSLSKLLNIEKLDLSSNALSGVIPKALTNLTYLANLNLSFNRLYGQIPEGGIAPCQNKTNHSRSKQQLLKVTLAAVMAILISASCLCMLVIITTRRKGNIPLPLGTNLLSYQLISYHELVRATRNFSDDNLLGSGSFGKVFKGQLDDESFIAVKVLNMQDESASKSFDTECRALQMARHRNLVKIISTCSNLDFKALILEYMPNGSLNDWLYSNDGRQLSFVQRVGIMLDVAMAIEYLHHQNIEAVLHCDLKPRNILLDKDMIAHISDFGISKLLVGHDNSIMLTSTPGTVGYMAPEFGSTGKASRASDIYSYGIVLLEIFTRKRPTDPMFVGELSLRRWVSQAFPHELSNVVDSSILQDGIEDASRPPENFSILNINLISIIELALLCSIVVPEERMTMNDVVVKLNKI
uniref:non-specific serine/threonine protein kinase n=1 Tax=Setaria italica TaxID=4555 RepID=K3XTC7_SETIT